MKHVILYIPGLGDHNLGGQQKVLRLWNLYAVRTEICAMNWLVDETWVTKLQRLLDRIDFYTKQGSKVSLVGISAGANAAMQAYVQRRDIVQRVALVCGKFQYPETVHPLRYKMNPCFREAIESSVEVLPTLTNPDKQKFKSFRPIYDNFLPYRETTIPGVQNATMPVVMHVGGIIYAITIGSWRIVRFLKKP